MRCMMRCIIKCMMGCIMRAMHLSTRDRKLPREVGRQKEGYKGRKKQTRTAEAEGPNEPLIICTMRAVLRYAIESLQRESLCERFTTKRVTMSLLYVFSIGLFSYLWVSFDILVRDGRTIYVT